MEDKCACTSIHPDCYALHVVPSDLEKADGEFNALKAKLKVAVEALENISNSLEPDHGCEEMNPYELRIAHDALKKITEK